MHITLKGDCEKIVCRSKEENIILYSGDRIEMENKNTISISSVATQKNEIWKCIYTFPLRVILAIFDILLMNSEWDWVEKFEPCTFIIENYLCNSCDNLEIKYNKSRFDKDSKKIITPEIIINDNKIKEMECCTYTIDLTVCFFKCYLKMVGILIWALIPLIIITMNAGKYSLYILFIDIALVVALTIKILLECQKYNNIKKQLYSYQRKRTKY